MPNNNFQTPIESSNTFILKIEDLVREILIQNSIPYYRIESCDNQFSGTGNDAANLPVIRIVTYFEDSIAKISDTLRGEFDVVDKQADQQKSKIDSFSYKHISYVASLKANRRELTEYKRSGDKKFEIHICSMLHDAWAGMKKELGYVDGSFPDDTQRDLYRVGALLEMADMEFLKIKSQLSKLTMADTVAQPAPVVTSEAPATEPAEAAAPMAAPETIVEIAAAAVVAEVVAPQAENTTEVTAAAENTPVENITEAFVSTPINEEPVAASEPIAAAESVAGNTLSTPEAASNVSEPLAELNVNARGAIEEPYHPAVAANAPIFFEDKVKEDMKFRPILLDENAQMTDSSLREYVVKSKLLREIDAAIAERAGAKINPEIDIEGDVERLRFLKVHTLKHLHEKLFGKQG